MTCPDRPEEGMSTFESEVTEGCQPFIVGTGI